MTTPERLARVRAVLDRRQPDLTVLLEHVHKPHNFAAILRTCDAVGVFEAHAVTLEGDRPKLNRAVTSGTGKWVRVRSWEAVERACQELSREGFQILAAHPAADAVDYRQVDLTRPTALLLGHEKDGVSDAAAELADRQVAIPMLGMVPSLNVSVAAAVILFEAQRQRTAAGLYEGSRLASDLYRDTLFEWAFPTLARRCREVGLPYPDVAEDGRLVGSLPR